MDKNHINLCLSGQSFRIVTDDDVDYVKQLEKRINSRIESYKKRYPQMSATRCTLLAMLELEDELARAKENYEALDAKISQLRNMPRINTPAARMTSARNGQQMTNAERNLPTAAQAAQLKTLPKQQRNPARLSAAETADVFALID